MVRALALGLDLSRGMTRLPKGVLHASFLEKPRQSPCDYDGPLRDSGDGVMPASHGVKLGACWGRLQEILHVRWCHRPRELREQDVDEGRVRTVDM